jgi:hypothetical protein
LSTNIPFRIENALLSVFTPISEKNIYLYTDSIDFIINMSTGSDVNVCLWIGEEELLKTFPINTFVLGIWSTSLKISRKYRYPGDYEVKVVVSNSISSVILKKNIIVMSNVSGLIVGTTYSPIIYLHQSANDSGRAYFLFSYEGDTCAASHSNVSFTLGESNSSYTFGPFWLGMDFFQKHHLYMISWLWVIRTEHLLLKIKLAQKH